MIVFMTYCLSNQGPLKCESLARKFLLEGDAVWICSEFQIPILRRPLQFEKIPYFVKKMGNFFQNNFAFSEYLNYEGLPVNI